MVEHLKDEGSRAQVVLSGALAGLVSRFVVAPLDVIKIRLQLQIHSLSDPLSRQRAIVGPTYKGTIGTLKHILREEGLTVSSSLRARTCLFCCWPADGFSLSRRHYGKATSLLRHCIYAMVASSS
jgi:hypothetical protein